jgi:hypothetical protein
MLPRVDHMQCHVTPPQYILITNPFYNLNINLSYISKTKLVTYNYKYNKGINIYQEKKLAKDFSLSCIV